MKNNLKNCDFTAMLEDSKNKSLTQHIFEIKNIIAEFAIKEEKRNMNIIKNEDGKYTVKYNVLGKEETLFVDINYEVIYDGAKAIDYIEVNASKQWGNFNAFTVLNTCIPLSDPLEKLTEEMYTGLKDQFINADDMSEEEKHIIADIISYEVPKQYLIDTPLNK